MLCEDVAAQPFRLQEMQAVFGFGFELIQLV